MKASKKKPEKNRRGVHTNPFGLASVAVAYITDAQRAAIMRPLYVACDCLRYDLAVKDDWNLLSDSANISIELISLGICTDAPSVEIIHRGLDMLGKIATRFHAWGKLQATRSEIDAIEEAVERHEIQLLYTSRLDMCEALLRLDKLKRQARKSADTLNLEVKRAA